MSARQCEVFLASLFFAVFGLGCKTGWSFVPPCQNGQCPNCPACQPTPDPVASAALEPCFGVEKGRIRPGRTSINGREVTAAEGHAAIGARLPGDESYPHLTIIGPVAVRQRVLADLSSHPVLSRLRGRYRVQDYDPADWPVASGGFVVSGNPTIYVQTPTGEVVHRQDGYTGPDQLAAALRKADPSYNPTVDPDVSKPAGGFDIKAMIAAVPTWAWVALIGGGGYGAYRYGARRSSKS